MIMIFTTIIVLIRICALLVAVILHEVSHGYAAYLLGDDTAKGQGRLTLNPIRHIDPVGSLLLPFGLWLLKSPVMFGWAKPVPIDTRKIRHGLKGIAALSAAGPGMNILLMSFGVIGFKIMQKALLVYWKPVSILNFVLLPASDKAAFVIQSGFPVTFLFLEFFFQLVLINFVLSAFNMIPIPPLDGSRLLLPFLSENLRKLFYRLERGGIAILFVLLYLRILDPLFNLGISFLLNILF